MTIASWITRLVVVAIFAIDEITIRSTVDCRIARTAVEHDLLLVHDDRDFDFIATVEPELRIYSGSLSTPTSSEIHEPAARYDA